MAPFAYIGARARLGEACRVFPGCYVGEDCELGKGCVLYPNAVLMAGTRLGEACVLQPGAVLGAEGFGFVRTPEGIRKIPQIGRVVAGDRVEVGANSAVDRAALSSTVLDDGTCLDNLVQVGHNVRLGKDCLIVSQVGISGSTHVGDNVTMAGQAGVARTPCASATGSPSAPSPASPRTSPTGRPWGGRPAVDYTTFMRTLALMPRFPELFKRLSKLEKELEALRATTFSVRPRNKTRADKTRPARSPSGAPAPRNKGGSAFPSFPSRPARFDRPARDR